MSTQKICVALLTVLCLIVSGCGDSDKGFGMSKSEFVNEYNSEVSWNMQMSSRDGYAYTPLDFTTPLSQLYSLSVSNETITARFLTNVKLPADVRASYGDMPYEYLYTSTDAYQRMDDMFNAMITVLNDSWFVRSKYVLEKLHFYDQNGRIAMPGDAAFVNAARQNRYGRTSFLYGNVEYHLYIDPNGYILEAECYEVSGWFRKAIIYIGSAMSLLGVD